MFYFYKYFLFDAATAELNLTKGQELNTDNKPLYLIKAEHALPLVSPYLFTFKENTPFADWYLTEGWGHGWGVIISSNTDFEEVYKHFRRFLIVKTEDEEQIYFRFYSPYVLRIFLPSCDPKQLREFFGPVEQFICEDEDPEFALVFSFEKNALKTQRITKESLFETTEQKNQGRKFFV